MFYQINSLCLNNFIHSSCLYSVMAHQESLSSTTIPAVWINQNILTQLLVLLTELNFICNNNTLLYFSTQNNQPFEPAGLSVNLTDIVLQAFFTKRRGLNFSKQKTSTRFHDSQEQILPAFYTCVCRWSIMLDILSLVTCT